MTRAQTYEDLRPLVELCRAGKLYEAEKWLREGNPVNLPAEREKRVRRKSPLEVAIEHGFHSLVQLLLQNGAVKDEPTYGALSHALEKRRLDLIQLLVEYGADVRSVDMGSVFEAWDPEIMEYFIQQGADMETGKPMAHALMSRVRTALKVFKQYEERFPSFQEQADIALRHHCKEGNLKWVSLLLWAGANPYSRGPADCCEEQDPDEEDLNALEWAAMYEHFDVFRQKKIKLDPKNPALSKLMHCTCTGDGIDFLERLLKLGFPPNDQENGGSSHIQTLLVRLPFYIPDFCPESFSFERPKPNLDRSESRDRMKGIHLLARHGAKWVPRDRQEMNDARRSLLKMAPDYTAEFVWIMSGFQACSRGNLENLLRTSSIRAHVSKLRARINELIRTL